MAYDAKDTIICISANGKTTSSSEGAARRMLVATIDGVLDFRLDGPTAEWQRQDWLLLPVNHVSCLVYDERNDLLFAGMHFQGGLLMSRDQGKTWERRDAGVASEHCYTLLVQYVGDQTILNLGTEPVMFYRSWDLGESWTAFPSCTQVEGTEEWVFPRSQPHIKHIASHTSEPETIYICVEQGDKQTTKTTTTNNTKKTTTHQKKTSSPPA